jgi:hypothetical protein
VVNETRVSRSLVIALLAIMVAGSFLLLCVPSIQDAHASSGLSIDGTATTSSCTSPCTTDITTSDSNDVVVVFLAFNAGVTVSSVVDSGSAGLTFNTRLACAGADRSMCEYYAIAPSPLTNEPIKITGSGNINGFIFGVNGADTASPYDANAGLPNEATQNSLSSAFCTVSTSNANDMIITDVADGGTSAITNPTGFSTIIPKAGGAPSFAGAYQLVSSTQSGTTVTWSLTSTATQSEALCDAIQSSVSVPISLGVQNGAAADSATVTCAGGGGSYTTSGGVQSFNCNPGTSVVVALTPGGANNEWCFSGQCTSSETFTSCSSGTCSTQSYNYYEEFQNTWQASTNGNGPPAWDSGLSIVPTGEQGGTTGRNICTISPASGTSTTASCSGWSDYSTAVTAPSTASGAGANVRWMLSGTSSYSPTTGGNTETVFTYYKQLQNTYQGSPHTPSAWDTGSLAVDGSGTNVCGNGTCGTSLSASLTTSDTNDVIVLFCAGASGTIDAPTDTAGLTWTETGSELSAGSRVSSIYYAVSPAKLSSDSITCGFASTQTDDAISAWGVNGANLVSPFDPNSNLPNNNGFNPETNPSCTMTTSNSDDLLITVVLSAGTWSSNPSGFSTISQSFSGAGFGGVYVAYDSVSSTQSSVAETFTTGLGRGNIWCDAIQAASPVSVTGTLLGAGGQNICAMGAPSYGTSTAISCSGWADYNTATSMGTLTVSANERWSPATSTYTDTTGGNTHTDNYYEQLQNTYQVTSNYVQTPTLDGTGNNQCTTSTTCTATLSTSHTNDVVVAACYGAGSGLTFSISDTGGLTWHQRSATYSPSNNRQIAVFYAAAASALSSDSIKCTSSVNSNLVAILWAVNGANTVSPFDSNAGLPGTKSGSSASPSCTVSTSNANDFVFAIAQTVGAVTWTASPSGFSLIAQNTAAGPSSIADYEVVSSTQSSVTESWTISSSGNWAAWCDAIVAASTFDSGLTFAITGTSLGSSGQTTCSISPASTASVASCTGYADYDTTVSFPTNPTGQASNTRWEVSGTSTFTDTTGGNVHNVNYYKQLQNIYEATPNAQSTWDNGLTAQSVVGTLLGASGQTICSITLPNGGGAQSCTGYVDYSTSAVIGSATIGGAPANSQWERSGACSFTQTTGGNTNNCNFYKQLKNTYEVTPNAQPTWDSGLTAQSVVGTLLGNPGQTVCSITLPGGGGTQSCTPYLDYDTAVVIGSATIAGAPANSQWLRSGACSFTQVTGGQTDNCNYYKQLSNTYTATPASPTIWDSVLMITATGTILGTGSSTVCTITTASGGGSLSCSGYSDYDFAVSMTPTVADGSNIRWAGAAPLVFTDTTGGNTHSVSYYRQLRNSYEITANAQGTFDPGLTFDLTGTFLGSVGSTACALSPASNATDTCVAWADYNMAVGFPTNPTGAAPNSRWQASGTTSFTQNTAGNTNNVNYYKQWLNTFQATPTTPSSFDSGRMIAFTGTSLGVPGATICSISPGSGAGATSCSGWSDNGATVSFGTSTGGAASSQWVPSTAFSGAVTSGGNVENAAYYEELQNTYLAAPVEPTTLSGSITFIIKGTVLGVASSTVCTISVPASPSSGPYSCSGSSDYGTAVSFPQHSGNNPANIEWLYSGTGSFTDTSGGNSHSVNYYEELHNTYTFSPASPTAWDNSFSPSVTGTYLGAGGQTICTASLVSGGGTAFCSGYSDFDTAVSFPSSISDGAHNQWTGAAPLSFTDMTGGNTHAASYTLQSSGLVFTADPVAPSSWDGTFSIAVTGTYFGVSATVCTITTVSEAGSASCSGVIDAGTSVTFANALADGANARWETGKSVQTPSAGTTTTADYYLQLRDTFQATPNAQVTWDAGLAGPAVTGTFLGVGSTSVCALTLSGGGGAASCAGWADFGLPISFGTIAGAPANSRWEARGATTFTDTGIGGNTFNVNYYKQYALSVVGGNGIEYSVASQTGDNYWDSGTVLTTSSDGVYGRAAGTGQRVASWGIDGGPGTSVATVGTVTTSSITMSAAHAVVFNSVTQYQLTLDTGASNALSSITPPTIAGDNYWYDSGTSITLSLDGAFGRGAGIGTRLADYSINGGANNPASTIGTVSVFAAFPITSPQSIATTIVTQFQVTLDATTVSALSSITAPSIAGDNYWYDSGTSVTVSLNGVWGRTPTTGNGLASYTINGDAPTNTATDGIVMVLDSVPIASPESIASAAVTQFFLKVTGGNAISYSVNPPIAGDVGWYDSGTALTVSSDGVYGRVAGTGQRVSSWSVDGSPSTNVATTGAVTTGTITMGAAHTVSFSSVVQYEVTLDSTSTAALSSCTAPSISGDDYWYDSDTSLVACSLHGVWGRSGGAGDRLTGYSVNGGPPTVVSTTGLVTPLSVANIASPQSVAATEVVQYMLMIAASPSNAGTVIYITTPAISGDTGWYDSGTTVTFSVTSNSGYIFGRWLGAGACSYTGGATTPSIVMSCVASESASFAGEVRESISLEGASPLGLTPYFEITGCNPAPDSIPGDGNPVSVELSPSCSFTVSIINTGSTRYGFSVSGAFSSNSPNQLSCASGTCGALTLDYFEQVSEQFAYSIVDGSSGFTAPTLTCTQAGTPGSCGLLTTSPASFWLDYGSSWSATNPLGGSNGTVRWESSAAMGLASESSVTTVVYSHQFLVAFQTDPDNGGITSPPAGTSQWVDSGSSLSLSEAPSSGFNFTSWASSSPAHVTFLDVNAGSTTASIGGPSIITARFNIALVALTFTESGLPAGTSWSVTVGGKNASSDTDSLTFDLVPAMYSWAVGTPLAGQTGGVRFVASTSGGTIVVGGPESQAISFLTQYYLAVSVGSSGSGITLAPASGWYDAGSHLSLNASASPSASLTFVSWTGTGIGSYNGPNAVAPISMSGAITETANFGPVMGTVTFVESGLPAGADWSVVLDGINQTSQGNSITFGGIPVGSTVDWVVQSPASAPGIGSLLVLSPQVVTVTITFTASPSTVTTTSTLITGSSSTATVTITSGTTTVVTTTSTSQGNNGLSFVVYPLLALVATLAALLSVVAIRRRGKI